MQVNYHVYKQWKAPARLAGASDEEIAAAMDGPQRREMQRLRYSLVSSVHHEAGRTLYLGATNGNGDILLAFDLASRRFRSCGFQRSGLRTPRDVKIHKGIHLDARRNRLYFGTATLSPFPETVGRPGGVLVAYDIAGGRFHDLGRPLEGGFYQSTCWDPERGLAYLFTACNGFAVYDFRRRKLLCNEAMESIPHNSCIDDDGGVWGTYSANHAFFRYNPDSRKFEFPGCRLPNAVAGANIMYAGAGPVDSMLNGGDGYLYIGTALGELFRLEPRKGELDYLGKPFAERRLPGLAVGPNGLLYVSGGYRPKTMLAAYDRRERRFERLGAIEHADGDWLEYVHEINVIGSSVFAMETDNIRRSGYLWECRLTSSGGA